MKFPSVDWQQHQFACILLQDFVTVQNGRCLELDKIEQQYPGRQDRIFVVHWPNRLGRYYQGELNLIEFNAHEYQIMQNLAADSDWHHIWHQPRVYQWQCLNGRECRHRMRAAVILRNWPNGVLSLGDTIPLPDWPYHTYWGGTGNETNYKRLWSVYGSCVFNIVTETQYDQVPGIVTEKTFLAVLSEQIPLVLGYQGIVDDCRDLGFDMFDDVLNLSYDNLPDDIRLETALELNRETILNYRPTDQVRQRLRDQREWLLHKWPELARQNLQHGFESVFRLRGLI